MRHMTYRFQPQSRILGALPNEPRDGLWHDAPGLSLGSALNEHVEVEPFGCQSFQRRLADSTEVAFVYILQETFLKIDIPERARVVVAQYALHVSGWQDLSDYVEHRIVVKSVADFLELDQKALKHSTFNSIGGNEVEDQAIVSLSVTMDTAHALFEPVRIPRDVIIEEYVAALQIDPLSSRLGCHQHLDGACAKLLLGVETAAWLVA